MTVFHLVRHGCHDLLGKVLTGRMPGVSLNADGIVDSEAAGVALATDGVQAIYAGPLERACETAVIIGVACRITPAVEAGIDEIDFGIWTGQSFAALDARDDWRLFNRARATAPVPGGETPAAVQERMVATLRRLHARHDGGAVALVGHGDPIKLALLHVLGAPLDATLRLEIAPGSISTIALEGDGARVLAVNRRPAAR